MHSSRVSCCALAAAGFNTTLPFIPTLPSRIPFLPHRIAQCPVYSLFATLPAALMWPHARFLLQPRTGHPVWSFVPTLPAALGLSQTPVLPYHMTQRVCLLLPTRLQASVPSQAPILPYDIAPPVCSPLDPPPPPQAPTYPAAEADRSQLPPSRTQARRLLQIDPDA